MSSADFHKQSTLPSLPPKARTYAEIPPHIGPYKIEGLLKEGSLTSLYLGIDEKTHIPVVIKTLAPDLLSKKEMVQQFQKEAEVIGLTDHPNIVKLLGQGAWDHGLYLATEFIQGIPLLQQAALAPSSALDIVLQVAYALLHLHTHGVIHRDLKPENILLAEDGQVKVIDFGIAQLAYEKSRGLSEHAGRVIGTPSYMSPEQRKNASNATVQSDIYSLGIILYELLTGQVCEGRVELGKLPKHLRTIVSKCIATSLDERYSDIVDVIKAISDYKSSGEAYTETKVRDEAYLDTYESFLPPALPDWPQFDMGLALPPESHSLNLYYDFLKFADGSYVTLLCESKYEHAESLAFVGLIKGMIRTLTRPYTMVSTERFNPMECVATLSDLIAESRVAKPMAFSLLYLCPISNEFSLISCGFESLWHMPVGTDTPHILTSQNPLLGQRIGQEFFEVTDSLEVGDTLFLHSFNTKLYEKNEVENVNDHLAEIVPPLLQKSAHAQSRALLERLSSEAKNLSDHAPKAVLAISRIT